LVAENAAVKQKQWAFFTFKFHHFDCFCWAVSTAQTTANTEAYIEHLFSSEVFRGDAFYEGIFACCGFFEDARQHSSVHRRY